MKTPRHLPFLRSVALAAALLAPALLQAQPDNATLRSAVARDLATQSGGYYEMSKLLLEAANVAPTTDKASQTSVHYIATVTGTLTQPFYHSVPTYDYVESIMQVNPAPAREAAQLLQGPNGEKLRTVAGKDATTSNLSSLRLIHETVPAGTPRDFVADITAVAQGKEWLVNSTFKPKTPPPQGAPRASYGSEPLSIDDVSSVVVIHEKVGEAIAASNRVIALQKQMSPTAVATTSAQSVPATVVTNNIVVPVIVEETKPTPIATAPVVATPPTSVPTRPATTTATTTYVTPATTYTASVPAATVVYNAPEQAHIPETVVAHTTALTPESNIGDIGDVPQLPTVVEKDVRGYAYIWTGKEWTLLPRNGARILRPEYLRHPEITRSRQHIGTLIFDGVAKPCAVSGNEGVLLAFHGHLRGFSGTPSTQSPIEVTRLEYRNHKKFDSRTRFATLERIGDDAATFGECAEPVTVQEMTNKFFVIRVNTTLTPGRYALYIPDRAFEFEIM